MHLTEWFKPNFRFHNPNSKFPTSDFRFPIFRPRFRPPISQFCPPRVLTWPTKLNVSWGPQGVRISVRYVVCRKFIESEPLRQRSAIPRVSSSVLDNRIVVCNIVRRVNKSNAAPGPCGKGVVSVWARIDDGVWVGRDIGYQFLGAARRWANRNANCISAIDVVERNDATCWSTRDRNSYFATVDDAIANHLKIDHLM